MTRDSEGERGLAWSPDGRRIAFMSDRAEHQDVYVVEVENGQVEQITTETNPWDEFRWVPEWSPGWAVDRLRKQSQRSDVG